MGGPRRPRAMGFHIGGHPAKLPTKVEVVMALAPPALWVYHSPTH